jgi:hypothetical protein
MVTNPSSGHCLSYAKNKECLLFTVSPGPSVAPAGICNLFLPCGHSARLSHWLCSLGTPCPSLPGAYLLLRAFLLQMTLFGRPLSVPLVLAPCSAQCLTQQLETLAMCFLVKGGAADTVSGHPHAPGSGLEAKGCPLHLLALLCLPPLLICCLQTAQKFPGSLFPGEV